MHNLNLAQSVPRVMPKKRFRSGSTGPCMVMEHKEYRRSPVHNDSGIKTLRNINVFTRQVFLGKKRLRIVVVFTIFTLFKMGVLGEAGAKNGPNLPPECRYCKVFQGGKWH